MLIGFSDSFDSEFEDKEWFFTDHIKHFPNETFAEHYPDLEENTFEEDASVDDDSPSDCHSPTATASSFLGHSMSSQMNSHNANKSHAKNRKNGSNYHKLIDFVIHNSKVGNRKNAQVNDRDDFKLNATDLFAYLQQVDESSIPDYAETDINSSSKPIESLLTLTPANSVSLSHEKDSKFLSKMHLSSSPQNDAKKQNIFQKISSSPTHAKRRLFTELFDKKSQPTQKTSLSPTTSIFTPINNDTKVVVGQDKLQYTANIILPAVSYSADKENFENVKQSVSSIITGSKFSVDGSEAIALKKHSFCSMPPLKSKVHISNCILI